MNKRKVSIALVAAGLLAGCSSVGAGQQAVEVDSWGDPTVSGCAKEETQVGTMTVNLYKYPARAISWDANSEPGAERGPYIALSNPSDQAEMAIPVTITTDLTTDCDRLKDFHRNYGTKYQGWLNDDGVTSDGWKQLLNYVIGQPAEQAIISITQKYPYQKVWNDEAVRSEYKNALQTQLQKESATRTGGVEYFTNFVVTVGKPSPTDERLKAAMALQQSSQAEANAAQTKATADANARKASAEADLAAAKAETATAQQDALKKQAEISGYPDVESYLRAHCIRVAPSCTPWPSPIIAGAR